MKLKLIDIIDRLLYFHGDLNQHGLCSFCESKITAEDGICDQSDTCPVREAYDVSNDAAN